MKPPPEDITALLREGKVGEDALLGRIYDELHGLAQARIRGERRGHTLQATGLVHEAWLRLVGDTKMNWRDRGHFYAAASEAMRRVLVDYARRARAKKRGGEVHRVMLSAADVTLDLAAERIAALIEALEQLASEDERCAAVARLRFLSGLSVEETASSLGISVRTVTREWSFARARLMQMLDGS
jgi:RNA polymerase sigma factor (TIGR02999 family)